MCVLCGVCEKATASRALQLEFTVMSNTATLRIHSDELKNKMINIIINYSNAAFYCQ